VNQPELTVVTEEAWPEPSPVIKELWREGSFEKRYEGKDELSEIWIRILRSQSTILADPNPLERMNKTAKGAILDLYRKRKKVQQGEFSDGLAPGKEE